MFARPRRPPAGRRDGANTAGGKSIRRGGVESFADTWIDFPALS
jgi:hypothetical protein